MSTSADLTRALNAANALVTHRRDGHLPRPDRLRITALAAQHFKDPAIAIPVLDALPIVQLAHLVAENQLDTLIDIVAFERDALAGNPPRARIRDKQNTCLAAANSAWSDGDNLSEAIWLGAAGMIGGFLMAEQPANLPTNADLDDMDLDPEDWDAAFECSVAASDGVPDERGGDRELRRRYWWWWLRAAVPTAAGLHGSPLNAVDARPALHTRELLSQRRWSDEQRNELRQALAHRAPSDPASWKDGQLKRQARDERR
jgi:hypothetical protein